jgi:acyl-CoA synthetase (NDP forming)
LSPVAVAPSADDSLTAALAPASIAVLGASDNPHKIGGRPISFLGSFGYRGRIYPVNPNRAEIQGHRAYSSVEELPETPEMVVIAVAGEAVMSAIEECAARGVKIAVVLSSGFGETGPAGALLQRRMVEIAQVTGMRITGPNSQGLANFGNGAVVHFSTMFVEVPPLDGPIAIVSQSGAMSSVAYGLLRGQGLGVRHVHATGNEADITVSELACAVADDPDVRLILLYMETVAKPDALARAAACARDRNIPIVALKSARTVCGQTVALSHTGALATEDRVVDAFFERHGIWRAADMVELVGAAPLYLKGWRPGGRKLVVISNSGASCVMAADSAERLDMPLAALSAKTQRELSAVLPGYATTANPIDITAALLSNSGLFSAILPILGRDPAADLLFVSMPVAGAGYDVDAFAHDTAAFMQVTSKPAIVSTPQAGVAQTFRNKGVPVFADDSRALAALAQLAMHSAMLHKPIAASPADAPLNLAHGDARFVSEFDSQTALRALGFPFPEQFLCRDAVQAIAAFRALGGPRAKVAVKACSADLPHKSEYGLVELNIGDENGIAETFARFAQKIDSLGLAFDGIIVAKMLRGGHEFVLGARIDPQFGPVVMLGDGGRYVEALKDFVLLMPPFSADHASRALQKLRIAPLYAGVRGEPALDIAALTVLAARLGDVMLASRHVASIDLNPVIVGPAGDGAWIADALIERNFSAVD